MRADDTIKVKALVDRQKVFVTRRGALPVGTLVAKRRFRLTRILATGIDALVLATGIDALATGAGVFAAGSGRKGPKAAKAL